MNGIRHRSQITKIEKVTFPTDFQALEANLAYQTSLTNLKLLAEQKIEKLVKVVAEISKEEESLNTAPKSALSEFAFLQKYYPGKQKEYQKWL